MVGLVKTLFCDSCNSSSYPWLLGAATCNVSFSSTTILMLLAPREARQTGRNRDQAHGSLQSSGAGAAAAAPRRAGRRRREEASTVDGDDNGSALVIFDSAAGRYGKREEIRATMNLKLQQHFWHSFCSRSHQITSITDPDPGSSSRYLFRPWIRIRQVKFL